MRIERNKQRKSDLKCMMESNWRNSTGRRLDAGLVYGFNIFQILSISSNVQYTIYWSIAFSI